LTVSGIGKIKPLFTQSHPPASVRPPPAPTGAHACGRPALARPAPRGTARTAAGRPARLGLRGHGLFHRWRPPPCRPRVTARGRPQLTSAQGRPPCAASAGRQTAAAGPARLGCWAGGAVGAAGGRTDSHAMSLLKNAMSLLLKRLIQKRLQPWRRSGGAAAEMDAHDGTARTSARRVHTRAGMERGARGEGEGVLHHGCSATRWGGAQDAGQPSLPTHRRIFRRALSRPLHVTLGDH
jgi:hypothetical protein